MHKHSHFSPCFCTFSFDNFVAGLAHIMSILGMLNQGIYFHLRITILELVLSTYNTADLTFVSYVTIEEILVDKL